jgi:diacylglycerol kinase (ATP)
MVDTAVLLNPQAGKLGGGNTPSVEELLPSLSLPYELYKPESLEDFTALLEQWRAEPPRMVVIAGGDGTIGDIWKTLLGKDVIYGIIPTGSLNNIARRLDIPLDPQAAIELINTGEVSRIDIGEASGQPFFESVGAGLLANIMERVGEQDSQKEVTKVMKATVAELFNHDTLDVDVSVDGRQRRIQTPWITVSNLGTIGAALVDPEADAEARQLSLVYCRELTKPQIVAASLQFMRKEHLGGEYFESVECTEIHISTKQPVPFHIDGQVVTADNMHISVIPGAVGVLRPRS